MNRPSLILANGKERSLQRRHPWIFSGAVREMRGAPAEGDIVDVYSSDGTWLAVGHYQPDTIVCKVLSFRERVIDNNFFMSRFRSAVAYRRRLGLLDNPNTNVFRLVNGEGDLMPGLICDYYAGTVVIQAHSVGMHRSLPVLAGLIGEAIRIESPHLPVISIFDKSSATVPCSCADGFLMGEEIPEREVVENGSRMVINFFEGQKTGFFVDQRDNRQLLASLSAGRRVLNCFGYTGGFSLAALRGGASYVETVDISRKAIDLCNRNVELNGFDQSRHRGVVADVLKYLDSVAADFDIIILDPPAFAKNHRSLQQGLKGYRNINQKAMSAITSGGLLFTFSCSQAVSRDDFQTMAFSSAACANRSVRIVRHLPHAADHPVSIYHPEGLYLKGLLLEIE